MLNFPLGVWVKKRFDSNEFAWTPPLPPWSSRRARQVRRIRTVARAAMRRRLVAEHGWLYVLGISCAWPAVALMKAVVHGRSTSQTGLPRVLNQWWLQLAHNLGIGEQQDFRTDRPEQRARVPLYVADTEHRFLMAYLNRDAQPERVRDKIPFARFCAQHGLPTVAVLAESEGAGRPAQRRAPLPPTDLFLKPAALWGGQGACRIAYVAADRSWRADDGTRLGPETVAAYADSLFPGLSWVLQPCLSNGPAWAKFSPGGLCTVRVVTGRVSPDAPPEVIGGFMRFPRRGAVVDNMSTGGWGADYDADGRMGPVRSLDPDSPASDRHPDTGELIQGVVIPEWERVSALARRAHGLISNIAMIGWDVALPGTEPVLIEANTNWGVLVDTPLGETRYVEILAQPCWRCF